MTLDRITFDSDIMGGKACVRGMRITGSFVLKLLAGGTTRQEILDEYPDLQPADLDQCLRYVESHAQG